MKKVEPAWRARRRVAGRALAFSAATWAFALALAFGARAAGGAASTAKLEFLEVVVHRVVPHDVDAFTQGLLWWDGKLYESTGRRGRSELRRLHPRTGTVEQRAAIPVFFFGEGLARAGDRLHMLTWHAERAFVFDLATFRRLRIHTYRGEGWGLCHDGERFVMSDGSNRLTFRDTDSFAVVGSIGVTIDGAEQPLLNELECVGETVYANIFQSDVIVRIDAATGRVVARIDAAGLLDPEAAATADVLNGIAYRPDLDRFYLTGKLWPSIFEVSFE